MSQRSGVEKAAIAANKHLYAGGVAVDEYLGDEYHRRRIDLCRTALGRQLAFAGLNTAGRRCRLLELGCSTAAFAASLQAGGYRVVAADAEWEPLRKEASRGLSCTQFDVTSRFPFADGAFDAVMMGELVEHIFDTRHLLTECHRVLVPNGALVLSTPNLASLQDRLRMFVGLSPRQVDAFHPYLHLHIRPFTARSLQDALSRCGFAHVTVRSNFVVWRRSHGARLQSRLLARLFPGLGGSLIVGCNRAG